MSRQTLAKLSSMSEEVKEKETEVFKYFCEDPKKTTLEDLLTGLIVFITNFENCVQVTHVPSRLFVAMHAL